MPGLFGRNQGVKSANPLCDYQKIIYKADRMPKTSTAPTAKMPVGLNMEESISRPLVLFLLFGSLIVMMIISNAQIRKTKPIRSRNGISYNPLAVLSDEKPTPSRNDKSIHCGRVLNRSERGNVMIAVTNAAVAVVRFQKKPSRKMASIPGETKPVYSWIN